MGALAACEPSFAAGWAVALFQPAGHGEFGQRGGIAFVEGGVACEEKVVMG